MGLCGALVFARPAFYPGARRSAASDRADPLQRGSRGVMRGAATPGPHIRPHGEERAAWRASRTMDCVAHPRATASPLSRETPRKGAAPQDEVVGAARPHGGLAGKLF